MIIDGKFYKNKKKMLKKNQENSLNSYWAFVAKYYRLTDHIYNLRSSAQKNIVFHGVRKLVRVPSIKVYYRHLLVKVSAYLYFCKFNAITIGMVK